MKRISLFLYHSTQQLMLFQLHLKPVWFNSVKLQNVFLPFTCYSVFINSSHYTFIQAFSPFLNVQQPCQNSPETRKPLAILKLEELLSFRKASSPYLDVWVPSVFLEGSKILHFNTRRCKIVNRWFFLQHSSISRDLFDDQRNLAPTSREKLQAFVMRAEISATQVKIADFLPRK